MLRKIANIRVPSGAGSRKIDTKSVFATYDKQSAAFAFYFSDNVDIENATADVLFTIDGQKVFMEDGAALGGTNETHTFIYPLPDKLLNYTGKVDGYLYLNFSDGSRSDEIHFTFTIKKSQIDEEMADAPDVYIKSFEEIKAGVQSKADQAKKDMQDNVDQVESDYQAWKEQQEAKQDKFENATDKKVSNIAERVGEAENKASDLERHLDVGQKNYFSVTAWENNASTSSDVVDNNLPAVKLKLKGNTQYTLSTNIPMYDESSDLKSVFFATSDVGRVFSGVHGVAIDKPRTITTNDDGEVVVVIRDKDMISGDRWIMLNKGKTASKWIPNADDLATKQELEKIKQAIINLGGSI